MTRTIALGTIFLGLSACASNPAEPTKSAVDRDAIAAAGGSGSSAGADSANAPVATGSGTAASSSASGDGIHVVEVPTVARTASAPAQVQEDHPDKLICRREKTTGSHRVTRVCRKRSQIEAERDAGQTMVRDAIRAPDGSKIR